VSNAYTLPSTTAAAKGGIMTENYAEIEELALTLERESQLLLDLLANTEQATPEVSRQIRDHFMTIQGVCIRAAEFLSEDADVVG
jgi:hypothetical protein